MGKATDLYRELVEQLGDKVGFETPTCYLYKKEHDNCAGCECEVGCIKTVELMAVSLKASIYQPKDFDDFEKMEQSIHRKQKAIIDAKTIEELKVLLD